MVFGLFDFARAHTEAEPALYVAQASDEFKRASRRGRLAVNGLFAIAHELLKLLRVNIGACGDSRGDLRARAVVLDSGIAHEHAARSRVNVFDGQIKGPRALLQLGHRGDEL